MDRQIKGILAATLVAPYLTAFFVAFFGWLLDTRAGDSRLFDILDFTCLFGTFALVTLGFPLLLISAAFDLILAVLKWRSPWQTVVIGTILGFGFTGIILWFDPLTWRFLPSGALSGTICGWIYWRIAIRRTPANGHAIDAP